MPLDVLITQRESLQDTISEEDQEALEENNELIIPKIIVSVMIEVTDKKTPGYEYNGHSRLPTPLQLQQQAVFDPRIPPPEKSSN